MRGAALFRHSHTYRCVVARLDTGDNRTGDVSLLEAALIDEKQIRRFSRRKQRDIRAQIAIRVGNGYPLKYLDLDGDGNVGYDTESHTDDIYAGKAEC
jgi:hypothetical protein